MKFTSLLHLVVLTFTSSALGSEMITRQQVTSGETINVLALAQIAARKAVPYASILIPSKPVKPLMELAGKVDDITDAVKELPGRLETATSTFPEGEQGSVCQSYYQLADEIDPLLSLIVRKTPFLETSPGAGNLGFSLYGLNEVLESLRNDLQSLAPTCADVLGKARLRLEEKMLYVLDVYAGAAGLTAGSTSAVRVHGGVLVSGEEEEEDESNEDDEDEVVVKSKRWGNGSHAMSWVR